MLAADDVAEHLLVAHGGPPRSGDTEHSTGTTGSCQRIQSFASRDDTETVADRPDGQEAVMTGVLTPPTALPQERRLVTEIPGPLSRR